MPALRRRLGAAALALLSSGLPALAGADATPDTPKLQFDATGLLYGEESRVGVGEPTARITRLFANGQTLSAQLGIDVITGATPTGALPNRPSSAGSPPPDTGPMSLVHTVTSASGGSTGSSQSQAGQIPTAHFNDARGAFDLDWGAPIGVLTTALSGHFSREKDYQSVGTSGKLSIDLMHRLTTLTVGGGMNYDDIFPNGGMRIPLSDGTAWVGNGNAVKHVTSMLFGISRVLTRRWLVGLNISRLIEQGYLTEPYKITSIVSPDSGIPLSFITENRPSSRDRRDVFASSVYHLAGDVVHASYRYYWDDWQVRSHTFDLGYRRELGNDAWLEPHLRYYQQTPAGFYRFGLTSGSPTPAFVTSDYRLGPLHSATAGATYGFRTPSAPGEWTIRAEYIVQFGDGHPADAVGIQRQFDLYPTINIGSLVVGYSVAF